MYDNVQKAMGVDIAVSQKMSDAIYKWNKMYTNEAPWLTDDIRSLNLPSSICQEMARLVTMEAQIDVTGSTRADLINASMAPFLERLPIYVELCCSTGGMVFKPYIDRGKIAVDVVRAGYFYPVEFNSAGIATAMIFPEFKRCGKRLFTRLEYQNWDGERYTIVNKAFLSYKAIVKMDNIINLGQEIPLSDVPEWSEMAPEVVFDNADRPLFAHFKIPIANNIDVDSPLGVSIYARAANQIRDADEQYGATLWEYRSKETAIQAADEFFKKDRTGKVQLPRGKERLYHAMGPNIMGSNDSPFFNAYSPEIRDQSFFNGYNKIVQKIEFNSGLAYGTLSDPQVVDKTAEEIKASKQRSYSTVKAMQNSLQKSIDTLIGAVDAWVSIEGLAPPGKINTSYNWDDSIVVDIDKERQSDRQDVAMGVMQAWEYRSKWYGEDEATAKARVVVEE